MRLLYVEDERLIRESVAKQIQKMFPLEVFTACHGEEGVELFKKYKPEIVLSDALNNDVTIVNNADKYKRRSGRSPESSGRYPGRNLHIRNVLPVRLDRCARRSEGEDEAPVAKYW